MATLPCCACVWKARWIKPKRPLIEATWMPQGSPWTSHKLCWTALPRNSEDKLMRSSCVLLILVALGVQDQPVVGPRWMVSSRGLMGQPAANVSAREMERLERYLVFGASYCNALAAQQYAANMAIARGMSTYLAAVSATAVDLQARAAAQRVAAAFSSFPQIG